MAATPAKKRALLSLLPLLQEHIWATHRQTQMLDGPVVSGGGFGSESSTARLIWASDIHDQLRGEYRLDAVMTALEELYGDSRLRTLSVWYEYVEPWREFEPARRQELAEEGIDFMLDRIEGSLAPYEPVAPRKPKLTLEQRDRVICALHFQEGWSPRRLAKEYNLTKRRVQAIIAEQKRTIEAQADVEEATCTQK